MWKKVFLNPFNKMILLSSFLRIGSNLLNYNVITVSLARMYRGIPSSSFEIEAIPPSPVGFASGDRVVLPQSLRTQTVFPDTSSPDSRYSINTGVGTQ